MANNLDFEQFQTTDLNLPLPFISSCKDSSVPIAIVGNGGSIDTLTTQQIDKLNQLRLFRCNWAFKDPSKIKKEYAFYLSQAYGSGGEETLVKELDESIDLGITKIYRFCIQILYNWNKITTFCTPEGHPVWPTSGVQLLWHAALHMNKPSIYIAGMDMYTYNRPSKNLTAEELQEWLSKHGKRYSKADSSCGTSFNKPNLCYVEPKTWSENVKEFGSTQHYLEIDILFTTIAFAHCLLSKTPIHIYNCPNLSLILSDVEQNLDLIKQYYSCRKQEFNDIETQPVCYSMWRLVNSIVDKVAGE